VFVDANGDGIRERNETAGVVGALVYVDLNRNGLRDRFEPFDRSVAPNGAWAIGGLAPGTYVIRQVPPPGYAQTTPTSAHVVTLTGSGDSFSGVQFGDKPVPPRVTGVYVSGATWSSDFMNYLGTSGLGDPEAGYLIDAATQARAVPWTAVDTLSVRFDSPVRADIGDLAVRGAGLLGYAVTEFAYDAATNTASWRLSRNVVNDRLRLALSSAGVMGASGLALDGEWSNGTDAYPSGDGAPGGDFNFAVNVLGGDSTGDGQVNALDLSYIKQRLNRSVANPGTGSPGAYTIFADLTSDGRINALDLSAAKQRLNRRLPRILPLPLPVEPLDPPVLTVGVQSITRDVFSETPLV